MLDVEQLAFGYRNKPVGREVSFAVAAGGNTLDFREGAAFEAFFKADSERLQRVVQALGRLE